jgi:HSP20 family protein
MNQLSHWNPFQSIVPIEANVGMNQLLRDFGMRSLLGKVDAPDIRIDVSENHKGYIVKADIPGATKDDIDVAVEGRLVSITARSSAKTEKKDGAALYTERREGQVCRSFSLPAEVDVKAASAKYEHGVLSLTLPKKSKGDSHRVKVG